MQNTFIRKNWDALILAVIGLGACVYTVWYINEHPRITVRYDCSIAEISPDYPIQVKEGCRKLMAEKVLKDLQKPK